MKTAVVTGWNAGFQKVNFTKWLRADFGYSLSQAKSATDGVLENQNLELPIPEGEASHVSARLSELGAKFFINES